MSTTLKVKYHQLGRSSLRVFVPIEWVLEEEASYEILKAAWDVGINTIDTANIYSNGESERIVAKFIQKIVITTKCYGIVADDPSIDPSQVADLKHKAPPINQSSLSHAAIFNVVEASLACLEISYIDLYLIHRYDPDVPAEETMKALHDLVQGGKVRYIGVSSIRCWQLAYIDEVAEKHGWTKFVSVQDECSLLYREEEHEMAHFNGIDVIPWAPLAGGDLTPPFGTELQTARKVATKGTAWEKKYSEADKEIINHVEEPTKKDVKMSQVTVTLIGQRVTSPSVGVDSLERLKDSVTTDINVDARGNDASRRARPVRRRLQRRG